MQLSNLAISLDFDLEETSAALSAIRPLLAKRERDMVEKEAAFQMAKEAFRDIYQTETILKDQQAELLNERFSNDEEISEWYMRHQ